MLSSVQQLTIVVNFSIPVVAIGNGVIFFRDCFIRFPLSSSLVLNLLKIFFLMNK